MARGKPIIGLVGGIGAGKSTVAAELAGLGCAVVDGDAIGHRVLGEEEVKLLLRRRWGGRVFGDNGSVDRQAVAEAVFADPAELKALTDAMYPRIRRHMREEIARAQADPAVRAVVLDAAVMVEAGWDDLCTDLVFVQAPPEVRARRVGAQRGWDEAVWAAREKSQIPLDKKAARCQYTLVNSSSASRLREQVRRLLERILRAADRP